MASDAVRRIHVGLMSGANMSGAALIPPFNSKAILRFEAVLP